MSNVQYVQPPMASQPLMPATWQGKISQCSQATGQSAAQCAHQLSPRHGTGQVTMTSQTSSPRWAYGKQKTVTGKWGPGQAAYDAPGMPKAFPVSTHTNGNSGLTGLGVIA